MVGHQAPRREEATPFSREIKSIKAQHTTNLPLCQLPPNKLHLTANDVLSCSPRKQSATFIYRLSENPQGKQCRLLCGTREMHIFLITDLYSRLVEFLLFVALKQQWFSSSVNTTASQPQYLLPGQLNTLADTQAARSRPLGQGLLSSPIRGN